MPSCACRRRAGLAEHRVTGRVSERAVDLGEAVEVDQQDRDRVSALPGPAQSAVHPFAKQRAVGQAGERVVAGEHVVLARLAAQAPRRLRDDPEQDRPQDGEADRHDEHDHALVVSDRGGDRAVAEIDLKGARRRPLDGEAQRHVDLDEFAEADLAGGLAVALRGDHLGVVLAPLEGLLQIAGRGEGAADQAMVVGVDDVGGVPDLDAREVLGRRARPQLLVELAYLRRREAGASSCGVSRGWMPMFAIRRADWLASATLWDST